MGTTSVINITIRRSNYRMFFINWVQKMNEKRVLLFRYSSSCSFKKIRCLTMNFTNANNATRNGCRAMIDLVDLTHLNR